MHSFDSKTTIVAPATPLGRGGVAIVRLSGSNALNLGLSITLRTFLKERHAHFSKFFDFDGNLIDFGIIIFFKGPNTFTGEDIIEFHCHGGNLIIDCIVEQCLRFGACLARPGEFSERAFFNNKMDLAQAESVADLIASQTKLAAQAALNSLQGIFSDKVNIISKEIISLRTYVEAAIDFPDEEIDFLAQESVELKLKSLINVVSDLTAQAHHGSLLREGVSVVIAGKPNAGKSSLMNHLLGENRAIVTEIPGTTRDILTENIQINGLPVRLHDTAGLRISSDLVEKEGISRAIELIKKSDLLLWLFDSCKKEDFIDDGLSLSNQIGILPDELPKVIFVRNKIDQEKHNSFIGQKNTDTISISVLQNIGIEELKKSITQKVGYVCSSIDIFSARRRHIESLNKTLSSLNIAYARLKSSAGELMAEDLREAHHRLGEIVGEFTSEDLLDSIFSSFCIGK